MCLKGLPHQKGWNMKKRIKRRNYTLIEDSTYFNISRNQPKKYLGSF